MWQTRVLFFFVARSPPTKAGFYNLGTLELEIAAVVGNISSSTSVQVYLHI